MLDDLLKAGKITVEQYELYMLFSNNELGREALLRMMRSTFMDEPPLKDWSGESFAFFDGRRSLIRDFQRAIDDVNEKIKKENMGALSDGQ